MTRQPLPAGLEDRYELGELLGRGGTAQVYRARDRRSGSGVAVKIVSLDQPGAQVAVQREIDALTRLTGVAGVVSLLDHGGDETTCWMALDRFDLSLADRLAAEDALTSAEARSVGVALAHTLAALHAAGLVHGDIKPSNVFLDADGRPVLGDLGTAHLEVDPTLTGPAPLSLQWAAPETIESGTIDAASDLYGLGATLHAARTGAPPVTFQETDGSAIPIGPALRLVTSGERAPLSLADDPELGSMIDELLEVDPARRPESAHLVAQRLARDAGPGAPTDATVHRHGAPEAAAQYRPTSRRLGAALVGLALVAMVVGFVLWNRTSDEATLDDPTTVATSASPTPTRVPQTSLPPTPTPTGDAPALTDGGWIDDGDPAIASIDPIDTEWGPGFLVRPTANAAGGAALAQSVGGLGEAAAVSVRVQVRARDIAPPNDETSWFQTLVRVDDELGNHWSINATNGPDQLIFNTGYFSIPDASGGSNASVSSEADRWHCIELVVQRAGTPTQQLWVDGQRVVALDDAAAAWSGEGHVVRVGAAWVEAGTTPPTAELADLAIEPVEAGQAPLGC